MVPQQDTYLNSRAEALHNVESTITELGGIFQQLAHMVCFISNLEAHLGETLLRQNSDSLVHSSFKP